MCGGGAGGGGGLGGGGGDGGGGGEGGEGGGGRGGGTLGGGVGQGEGGGGGAGEGDGGGKGGVGEGGGGGDGSGDGGGDGSGDGDGDGGGDGGGDGDGDGESSTSRAAGAGEASSSGRSSSADGAGEGSTAAPETKPARLAVALSERKTCATPRAAGLMSDTGTARRRPRKRFSDASERFSRCRAGGARAKSTSATGGGAASLLCHSLVLRLFNRRSKTARVTQETRKKRAETGPRATLARGRRLSGLDRLGATCASLGPGASTCAPCRRVWHPFCMGCADRMSVRPLEGRAERCVRENSTVNTQQQCATVTDREVTRTATGRLACHAHGAACVVARGARPVARPPRPLSWVSVHRGLGPIQRSALPYLALVSLAHCAVTRQ